MLINPYIYASAGGGEFQTAYSGTLPEGDSGRTGTFRTVLDSSRLLCSGSEIRVLIGARASRTNVFNNIYIGHQASSGNFWDFDGNQVQLTFSGNAGVTVVSGSPVWSDNVAFNLDQNKRIVLGLSFTSQELGRVRYTSGWGWTYYNSDTTLADDTAPTGFSNHPYGVDNLFCLMGIEAR